jgi:hypothetical protein
MGSRVCLFIAVLLWPAATASGQVLDTLLTWRTYAQPAQARIAIYRSNDDNRPLTAVIDELASNRSGPVTDDARFVAETIGRLLGRDPAEMTFVFRFSTNSFCEEAAGSAKGLLIRATFARTRTGALASPLWRVITRDELARLTDRAVY